jgi:NAD(P)H dehydrogenase (quinone)
MQALIVLAHPNPNSFNAALAHIAATQLRTKGHSAEVLDLYAEGFDPVEAADHYRAPQDAVTFSPLAEQRHAARNGTLPPDVSRHITALERADLVMLQFPLWWHAQPAILKGWFDRVFVSGGLYTSGMRYDRGYFKGKRAMLSVTTGGPEPAFRPGGRGGDIGALLYPIQYSLYYLGFSVLPPFVTHGVQGHGYRYRDDGDDATARQKALDDLGIRVGTIADSLTGPDQLEPLQFPGWADWDAQGAPLRESAGHG